MNGSKRKESGGSLKQEPEKPKGIVRHKTAGAESSVKSEPLEASAFRRQIKRRIHAPVHRFVAVVPPELSLLCLEEVKALGTNDPEMTDAGVEFSGNIESCYRANLQLRTASRILCRFPEFRAGTKEELFFRASEIRWDLWLNPAVPIQVAAHVDRSRVSHEGLVAQTVLESIQRHFRAAHIVPPSAWAQPPQEETSGDHSGASARQRILVRLIRNHCEVSVDTTGGHLHQRGYRLHHTGAPLRETLAAAILMKAGWRGDSPLVDGMCGAGTIAIEGALISRRIPPGLGRHFLFEQWPSFRDRTWEYLRQTSGKDVLDRCPCPIMALDREPEAIEVAGENAETAGVADDIRRHCMDFFDFDPGRLNLPPGLLVLNPPYGKRISGPGRDFYGRLGVHLRRFFEEWHVAVLSPERAAATGMKIHSLRYWKIVHGGIPITVAMGRV